MKKLLNLEKKPDEVIPRRGPVINTSPPLHKNSIARRVGRFFQRHEILCFLSLLFFQDRREGDSDSHSWNYI